MGGPSPARSVVQEVGVSEASSWPDVLPVGLGSQGVRGLAPAAPSSLAGHQLGGPCCCRPRAGSWVSLEPCRWPAVSARRSLGRPGWRHVSAASVSPSAHPALPGRSRHQMGVAGVPSRAHPSPGLCSLLLELPRALVCSSVQRGDNPCPDADREGASRGWSPDQWGTRPRALWGSAWVPALSHPLRPGAHCPSPPHSGVPATPALSGLPEPAPGPTPAPWHAQGLIEPSEVPSPARP